MNILIIGNCGVGKTYVMTELIRHFKCDTKKQIDLIHYSTNGSVNIVGKYDGQTFQGSDRLSMAVMTSVDNYLESVEGVNIYEGDRFTNSKFISKSNPFIIRIKGSGLRGRELRGSTQSERQIRTISTRVGNITPDIETENSTEVFNMIKDLLIGDFKIKLKKYKQKYKPIQSELF